ncbi:family 43 glycosylhydrolase [Neolewinella persica]|uniref:family 43 glycosylhydrolase n=1 Tax=Neolewinella persica TaxID=70998 RepID=UPI0009FDAFAA|nr:family 43 glycosylhydrolase [Neolewinella persica]
MRDQIELVRRALQRLARRTSGQLNHSADESGCSFRPGQRVRIFILLVVSTTTLSAQNPIVPSQGLNDPHIHIFNDTAYVYASHDKSADNTKFTMEDWWIWSSPDLVNWTKRSVLKPEDTYIGGNFDRCWATDVGYKNGKYYWYFSEGNQQTGVVEGPTPTGPWTDKLGKPLLTEALTPTDEYDMAIFEENGEHWIIFGVWDYYIARLGEDMMSLAEEPRKLALDRNVGPYGAGKTDDKAYLHKRGRKYYLSWGCFYAMADDLYGPYEYQGCLLDDDSFAPGYDSPTWPNGYKQGRHGNFFEWHGQWYYTYCDISQTGNRWFRDAFISYVHYNNDGTMANIRVDGVGVGWHPANTGVIPAEEYFAVEGMRKEQDTETGFRMVLMQQSGSLIFPKIMVISKMNQLTLKFGSTSGGSFRVDVRRKDKGGMLLATTGFELKPLDKGYQFVALPLKNLSDTEDLYFEFHRLGQGDLRFDGFSFK